MNNNLSIALAQLNLTVGDIKHNLEQHKQAALKARDELKAKVIVFPELSLTGYTPEDLLYRNDFLNACDQALVNLTETINDIYCLVGHPLHLNSQLFNAASLIYNGKILAQYKKQCLPNYGVFDEHRYFAPGNETCVVDIEGIATGIVICEDLWHQEPVKKAAERGAKLILAPNASPFAFDKHEKRQAVLSKCASDNKVNIVYVNLAGGQDEIVFDGGSMLINTQGQMTDLLPMFEPALSVVTLENQINAITETKPQIQRIYQALVLGIKDYIEKNNFPGVLLGLSGGIDSALVLALAVDALGADRVHAVGMPSRHTADMSIDDAKEMAANLQVKLDTISIESSYQAFLKDLQPYFQNKPLNTTEENIQARCRAILLMALSNKHGHLVLTTGNRSEMAVGYCTLYGDMAGGYAPLKDIPKMMVYALANYRNSISPIIPQNIIDRAPSAELAPNQKDQDSLPPYPILDEILYLYLNQGLGEQAIIDKGFEPNVVKRIIKLIYINEYNRRQSAIGPRIDDYAFGKDRRFPITNKFI